jgi:enoyl-CoA hydratase/carnithine racemase
MAAIAATAIPTSAHVEAMLHAHAYSPAEALQRGILNGLVPEGGDVVRHATLESADLLTLPRDAYATTKRRLRAAEIARVEALLEGELAG